MAEKESASHIKYSPCKHISTFDLEDKNKLLTSYKLLHVYYVSCIEAKDGFKRKAKDSLCCVQSCPKKYRRVHACLSCDYFGCFIERHIHHHAENKHHILAMDTNFAHVFCHLCNDYIYDPDFDKISQKLNLRAAKERGIPLNYYNYLPFSDYVKINKMDVINLSNIGLRGMHNLGKGICYLNVIIQSLIHAPVFRDYFLSSNHKCEKQSTDDTQASCFVCEMSSIVHEFFSDKRATFFTHQLLFLLWKRNPELCAIEGTSQMREQDPQDCFFELLNGLHEDSKGSSDKENNDDRDCKCIICTIFHGIMMYTYSCFNCNNSFIRSESFRDISLNLEIQSPLSKDNGVILGQPAPSTSFYWLHRTNQPTKDNGPYIVKPENIQVIPLEVRLRRSMQSQVDDYQCSKCSRTGIHNLQITLKQLPIIITFCIRDFCDISNKRKHSNSKRKTSFPEFLDMTPFMEPSKTQNSDNDSNNKCNSDNLLNGLNGKAGNKFYLFAVVEHALSHFRCYVRRHKNNWFRCNDEHVEPIELERVLMSDAYLLFYHKMVPEYDPKDAEDICKNAEDKVDCKDAEDKMDCNV